MKYYKEDKELVRQLLVMRDNANCTHTHWKAVNVYNKIKFDLAKRVGDGIVIHLGYSLEEIDPYFLDCGICDETRGSFSYAINQIICMIAPHKEVVKYMRECPDVSHCWDDFRGYSHSTWNTVERCYRYGVSKHVRHDDKKTAKWRKYNNY